MAERTYIALLEPTEGGAYGVSFPDLPGCVSFGADLDAAMLNGSEALGLHLEGMVEDKEPFPDATPAMPIYFNNAELRAGGGLIAAVTAKFGDAGERVNVYVPKSLINRVDRWAEANGVSRSSFFGMAARAYLLDAVSRVDVQQMQARGDPAAE